MAERSLTEGGNAFNQSPSSSTEFSKNDPAFKAFECLLQTEQALVLTEQAEALVGVAMKYDVFGKCSASHRYHYLAALYELTIATKELLEDIVEKNPVAAKKGKGKRA